MDQKKIRSTNRFTTAEIARMALVTGLYVAVTFVLSVISFGAIQIRLSEMFNYLSLYNKKYILAITLGVALANLSSPLGWIDVVVGSISTLLVLLINYEITKRVRNMKIKMVITALVFAFSMFTVAGQLKLFYQLPFFFTWGTVALGELASMLGGGVIIYWVGQKVDLKK